jgi:hypothetical protein
MAVRLLALRAGRTLPPGRFLVLISVRGWVHPRAIVRIRSIEKSISSGLDTATFRLVAKCLSQLRYRMPQYVDNLRLYLTIFVYSLQLLPVEIRDRNRRRSLRYTITNSVYLLLISVTLRKITLPFCYFVEEILVEAATRDIKPLICE